MEVVLKESGITPNSKSSIESISINLKYISKQTTQYILIV
jgi:hypothetical protein